MRAGICRHDRLRRACDECDMVEEIATLRADLARVTGDRDEAMAALEGVSNALGGLELYELSETAGHVETVVADRDEALADLARVTVERDEARTKVAGLTLNPDAVARAKGACSYFAALDLMTDHGRAKHRETVEELTRYAEALGVRS